MSTVNVLVVDDQRLFREALVSMLELEDEIDVVGEACDGQEAIESAIALYPDVILMDLRMPDMDGITAMREIKAQAPDINVILLTMFDEEQYVYEAVSAGASGYLVKDASRNELIDAILAVASGRSLMDPNATARLLSDRCGINTVTLSELMGKRREQKSSAKRAAAR